MEVRRMTAKEGWRGRFFEDFEVGDVYEHPLGRTVTTTDNMWFTLLTQNTAPIHVDHAYAAQTEFGRPLVDSTFTLALVTGQSVTDISQNVFANLGWEEVRLPAPVFEGDTIYSSSEVLEKRESRSRPNVGIVAVRTTDYNQDGTPVITFTRPLMVYRRDHCPRDSQADFRRCDMSIMARTATTREWVSFLAQLHYEDIPDAAVEHTREYLWDWIRPGRRAG
jgi:itaconyl-CoA hydratase